ncbi:ThiF family adenylyltransferase [Bacillus sp. SCS-151]|uniref:ThiF family adenylyltransferase n=1 Tax=Nanhaiella sioensis TaxID=3115293 RepID=UPI00397E2113
MQAIKLLEEGKKKLYFQVVTVGVGANGGQFFRSLCQDIRTHFNAFDEGDNINRVTFGVDLTICDADKYERKNLSNQLCTEDDIGEYKVEALAERYAGVYDISVKSVTEYIKSADILHKLFTVTDISDQYQKVKVLCGMVDNNKSRQLFHDYFYSDQVENLIWLDTGVTGVELIDTESKQTEEERKSVEQSGFSGQIVVGFKYKGVVILEPATVMFPNILEDAASHFPDESCGELIINNPQRSATNKMAALLANNVMNNLFHTQSIYNHVINFNAQFCDAGGRISRITKEQYQRFEELKQVAQ